MRLIQTFIQYMTSSLASNDRLGNKCLNVPGHMIGCNQRGVCYNVSGFMLCKRDVSMLCRVGVVYYLVYVVICICLCMIFSKNRQELI